MMDFIKTRQYDFMMAALFGVLVALNVFTGSFRPVDINGGLALIMAVLGAHHLLCGILPSHKLNVGVKLAFDTLSLALSVLFAVLTGSWLLGVLAAVFGFSVAFGIFLLVVKR